MRISISTITYLLLTTLLSSGLKAQCVIQVMSDMDYYDLKEEMHIYVDDDLGDPFSLEGYQPYSPSLLNPDRTSHWFRACLSNPTDTRLDLFISTFFLDSIVVYRQPDRQGSAQLLSANNGYLLDASQREYPFYQTSIVPLSIPAHSSDYYYFHVINRTQSGRTAMKSSMRMGFLAYTAGGFQKWYGWGTAFNFFIAGIMLIIAVFNFTLYVISGERNYCLLSFNNLAYLIWVSVFGGMLIYFDLVTDLSLERSIRLMVPTIAITLSYSLYAMDFLYFRKNFPVTRIVLLSLLGLHTAMLIPHLMGYHEQAILVSEIISPCIYIPILICSFIHWKRGNVLSLYFFFASLFFNIGLIMYLFAYNSSQTNYLVGHYLAQICFILEVLTFSIITTQRFLNLRISHAETVTKKNMLEKELNNKNRQLTALVVAQIRKNELLEDLKSKIKSEVKEEKAISILKKEVNGLLNFDNNWENFKLHFEQVHPDFFASISRKCDKLTTNEFRLAAFLKMGLKNKEIAVISGISVRGVEKAKERLKKKLQTEDLIKLIAGLES